MDIGDMVSKAKETLADHESEVDNAIDKAKEAVQDKTPDGVDSFVEKAADEAKNAL